MLVSFYGKLPYHAEFLISNNPPLWSKTITDWMIRGQGQLGEMILKQNNKRPSVYFFMIDGHDLPVQISGIFLASHDSRHREFAFVLFHEYEKQSLMLIRDGCQEAIRQASFDISLLADMNNDELLDGYENFLQRVDMPSNEGIWQSAYCVPERLSSTQLSSTLYRKLIMSS